MLNEQFVQMTVVTVSLALDSYIFMWRLESLQIVKKRLNRVNNVCEWVQVSLRVSFGNISLSASERQSDGEK